MRPVTLAIDTAGRLPMDPKKARALGSLLAEDYRSTEPFPHIVMEGILPDHLMRQVLHHLPKEKLQTVVVFDIGYGDHHKREVMPEQCDPVVCEFFHSMNSRPMLQFLDGLTSVDALLPDPYFNAGGFHEASRDVKLGVHADSRIHGQLNVQRRINLPICLNEARDDEWRG